MTGRLAGKRVFVTAAGQGIGRASVLAMLREGAAVVATDIDPAALDSLRAEAGSGAALETARLDVTDGAAVARAAAGDAPDVLVSCAGWVAHGTILDCDEAQWARSVEINLTATFRVCRAFLPGMIARGGGSIVTIASVASSVIAAPNRFAYGATKAGVIGLTRSIACDFVGQGIRANAICPGTVDSPSLQERLRATGDYEAARAAFVARQPIGRIGRAEEVAALVVHLASDESAYTTGAVHIIDGGWTNI
ncbi:SDR family oxidoreductase [Rubellimicrobium sp. CFH 75288]|uniref:SDR family oxidoreductase n=1 Tax=Rubellimicrobium sp. CFH 75288 TaxID=2697034 RepID=UPI0014124339|nr:SDR family oxidoreductase [Rubellimicrobium sp. CFH 75288]NAZ35501.1 SDR family oxidoreductase [Rubellimicrobium sp. CFH 75288]